MNLREWKKASPRVVCMWVETSADALVAVMELVVLHDMKIVVIQSVGAELLLVLEK